MKKYEFIYEDVKKQIEGSVFRRGDQLPTEADFIAKYDVSRPTVAKALKMLEDEGLILRSPGLGTFVQDTKSGATRESLFGIAFPEMGHGEIFDPIASSIAGLGKAGNYSLLWGTTKGRLQIFSVEELVDLFREFIAREVDGVFFAPLEGSPEAAAANLQGMKLLSEADIPVVLIDRDYLPFPDRSNAPLIGIDNFRAGYTVAGHYLSQKAERIDFVWLPYAAFTVSMRIRGYQAALSDAGIIASSAWVHIGDPEDKDFAKTILDSGAQNLICGNDETAALLMNTFRDMNVDIPSEVRLAAFDDVKYGRFISVPLTTVHQPIEEIARRAVLEMERCRTESKGIPGNTVFLHSDLIIRKSSLITR